MIIVLTLGRSGSSLLMQTLRILGVEIAGRAFDMRNDPVENAEHHRLNPGGYFEEPQVYFQGTLTKEFGALVTSRRQVACKMDLRHFVDQRQANNWKQLATRADAIFVSFREPSEQAQSEFIASCSLNRPTGKTRFQFVTSFLKQYQDTFFRLHRVLETELSVLASRTHFVDFRLLNTPAEYVRRICQSVGLSPTSEVVRTAEQNIDPNLYRIRRNEIEPNELTWAELLGATGQYSRIADSHPTDSAELTEHAGSECFD